MRWWAAINININIPIPLSFFANTLSLLALQRLLLLWKVYKRIWHVVIKLDLIIEHVCTLPLPAPEAAMLSRMRFPTKVAKRLLERCEPCCSAGFGIASWDLRQCRATFGLAALIADLVHYREVHGCPACTIVRRIGLLVCSLCLLICSCLHCCMLAPWLTAISRIP